MKYRESIILLPCHSLEDFPTHHEGDDAQGLLANWSALWHPALIASSESVPAWHRVDDPLDRPHEGPLSGLAAGLGHLVEREVALACLAPCDALWLDAEHVRFMLRTLEQDRGHAAIVPETGPLADGTRVLHPLCGAVRVEVAWQTARALLQSGQRAARALLLGLNARRLAVATLPQPRVVEGCNTPEQWDAAVAELVRHTDASPAVE